MTLNVSMFSRVVGEKNGEEIVKEASGGMADGKMRKHSGEVQRRG